MSIQGTLKQAKSFWSVHEQKIVVLAGFLLVAAISFEAGALQGQKWQQKPLIIEKTAPTANCPVPAETALKTQNLSPEKLLVATIKDCAFVGSKNSDKYHVPTCQWAKRIKPENVVCFRSAEEAVAKGYQPDKGCIK
ncbi:hypothetical protein EPO05_01875 [Patescibacteria group bacterium]|nr:MAG: hypothetical protein EPO05_01875 [Patescibacteria group bacterium]